MRVRQSPELRRGDLDERQLESGSFRSSSMPLNIGFSVGHYDVTALIGEGGMGQVYRVPTGAKGWQDA